MGLSRDFLDCIPFGVYRTTPNGRIDYANQAFADLLGYPSIDKIKEVNATHFYADASDRDRWLNRLAAASGSMVREYELTWRRASGQSVRVVNSGRALLGPDGNVKVYEGIVTDVASPPTLLAATIRQRGSGDVEACIRDDNAVDAVFDMLPICITRKDRNRRVTWANKEFCKLEGVTKEELLTEKNSDVFLYGGELAAKYRESDDYVFRTGKPHKFEEEHRYANGSVREVEVIKIPLFDKAGSVTGVEIYFWDIETLAEPATTRVGLRRFETLLKSPSTAIYEHDMTGKFVFANDAARELIEHAPNEWLKMNIADVIAPESLKNARETIKRMASSSNPADSVAIDEFELVTRSGRRIPVEIISRLQLRDGKPHSVIGLVRDLTQHREAEQRRLSEVHHRVKNNLHTISSLLERARRDADTPSAANVLRDCNSRVLAIADLHEQLYRANRVDRIAVADYVRELASNLVDTYSQAWHDIAVRVTVDKGLFLSLDAMIPCALVLQELISNAMKHAFPRKGRQAKRHGSILVGLSEIEEGVYQLQVTDTGEGLPRNFDAGRSKSLGLRLVCGLIERQLKGQLQFGGTATGTSFSATFRDPSPILPGRAGE